LSIFRKFLIVSRVPEKNVLQIFGKFSFGFKCHLKKNRNITLQKVSLTKIKKEF
jgi:hypothetical protein